MKVQQIRIAETWHHAMFPPSAFILPNMSHLERKVGASGNAR